MSEASVLLEQCEDYLIAPNSSKATTGHLVKESVERYKEPWRFYHTVRHLGEVAGFLIDNIDQLRAPRPTLWAVIGHDAVYVPQAPPGVNEALSAQLITARLESFLPRNELVAVGSYIEATASHEWDGNDTDLAFLLDADLKILGAPPGEFDEYDRNIRLEYSFVDPAVYREARAHILTGFYEQKRLFVTDVAYEQFEDAAKANLERKIGELSSGPRSEPQSQERSGAQ